MESFIHKELSQKVMSLAFKVHNVLGSGLLEHAYKEAMCIELRRAGIPFSREKVYTLEYLGENVGTYQADIVVDNKIILELKSVLDFHPSMDAQTINYLKVSGVPVGYLINFHKERVEWKRFINKRE